MSSFEDAGRRKKDKRRANNSRLRLTNARRQIIESRQPNLSKATTGGLPRVRVEADALDLYSEVQPLDELIYAMKTR